MIFAKQTTKLIDLKKKKNVFNYSQFQINCYRQKITIEYSSTSISVKTH